MNAETNLIELAHHIIREATGEEVTVEIVPNKPTIFNAVKFKNRLGIIPVCTPDVNAVLDICKVADLILFAINEQVEEFALEMMTCIYAQGLPVCLAMVSVCILLVYRLLIDRDWIKTPRRKPLLSRWLLKMFTL